MIKCSNRTFMELKCAYTFCNKFGHNRSNRTFMELKCSELGVIYCRKLF